MSARIIDGKKISQELRNEISKKVEEIKQKHHIIPGLAVILVGNDSASQIYVSNKEKAAHQVGMNSFQFKMTEDISEDKLIDKIEELNQDSNIHGILVQLPLPKSIDAQKVIRAISPEKDVDGFNIINVGKLSVGQVEGADKAIIPCTPLGCLDLIKRTLGEDLKGLKSLVIGASNIVGRPTSRLLMLEGCTNTTANRSTKDLKAECLNADIIISATGVAGLIKKDMVKKGATIIDVGINRIQDEDGKSRLVGDVDFEGVKEIAGAITPVPGGVGPMTIAYLLSNTVQCCLKIINKQN